MQSEPKSEWINELSDPQSKNLLRQYFNKQILSLFSHCYTTCFLMENNLTSLEANIRETKTKSDIKKLRIDGFVPGVLYGEVESNLKLRYYIQIKVNILLLKRYPQ